MNKAESFKWFIDWAFSKGGSYNALMESIKEAITIGQGFAGISLYDDRKTIEILKGKKKVKLDLSGEIFPMVRYVPAFNIYYDPTIERFADAPYVIERRVCHSRDIIKQYKSLIPGIANKIKECQCEPYYFSLTDMNRIKLTALWNVDTLENELKILQQAHHGMSRTGLFDLYMKNFLTVNYEGGYSEVIEYWEDDRRIILIDGHTVYD